jgi:uncharacterized membrane protein YcaP (DUF421 family)
MRRLPAALPAFPAAEPEDQLGMAIFVQIFGIQNHNTLAQECARAVVVFFYALALLRLSGRRTFAHWSALDIVVSFIIGSALARAMTASAPFLGTLAAAAVMVLLHILVSHALARSQGLARFVEGKPVVLIDHGRVDENARKRHMIALGDLQQALRQDGLDWPKGLENVKRVTLEANGKLSVIKHEPCRPDLE